MRKSILALFVGTLITVSILTSGSNITPKEENMQKKVVAISVPGINKFRVRIEHNEKKIAELEQKNHEIKMKLNDYQAEGQEKWEAFKIKFGDALDVLVKHLDK